MLFEHFFKMSIMKTSFFSFWSKKDAGSFLRLMAYVSPYKMRIVLALVAIIGVAAIESYLAAFISPLVNMGFATPSGTPNFQAATQTGFFSALLQFKERVTYAIWGTPNKVWIVPLFFIAMITARGFCRFASSYLLSWVGATAVSHLRRDMFQKMLLTSSEYQQENDSATLSSRFLVQAEIVMNNASNVFITITRDALIVVGLVCVLLYLNWQLSLVVLLMFPCLSLLSQYYRKRLKSIQQGTQAGLGELAQVINETHQGHRVVKLFNGYPMAEANFAKINQKILSLSKKLNQASAARSPFSELIASIALAVVIFIALWQSQSAHTTIGDFMAFIVAMLQMVTPIKNLSNVSIPMQGMFIAADTVCAFLDTPNEEDNGQQKLSSVSGSIVFDDVSVRYKNQDHDAIEHLNLSIRAGEKVALVGRSGSGKSTLVNLLPRFIHPVSGSILLDGHRIDDLELNHLRQQFALVSQDVFLFDGSLYQNVLYGRSDASDDEVREALKAANLWDFVCAQAEGWHMNIGHNGNQLSGGQRQRVSIARAILKNALILLLDEATSALDNESERLVQESLERLMANRTSIIVAHRLSTIEQADRIVVMDQGKIIEEGTHAQLMSNQGYYAKLQQKTVH